MQHSHDRIGKWYNAVFQPIRDGLNGATDAGLN
jgi:hypothetical protein